MAKHLAIFAVTACLLGNTLAFPSNEFSNDVVPKLGFRKIHPRIVGGEWTSIEEFPYQVSLQYNDKHACGGAILNQRWVLTSGRCISLYESQAKNSSVVFGTSTSDKGGIRYSIEKRVVHPKAEHVFNDIGLLKLSEEIVYSEFVQPVELPKNDELPENRTAVVTGWGSYYPEHKIIMSQLRKLDVEVIDNGECKRFFKHLVETHLCTKNPDNQGQCFGDTGNPVVLNGVLVGVSSFVLEECANFRPDINIRISSFVDWIKENIAN